MSTLHEFIIELGKKYGVSIDISVIDEEERTLFEIIKKVFPKESQRQWLLDKKEEYKKLRQQFKLEPFDKFDTEIDEEIAKL